MPTTFYETILDLKPSHITTDAEYARFLGIGKALLRTWRLQSEAGHTDFLPKRHLIRRVAAALNKKLIDLIPQEEDQANEGES